MPKHSRKNKVTLRIKKSQSLGKQDECYHTFSEGIVVVQYSVLNIQFLVGMNDLFWKHARFTYSYPIIS